jgi:hypothetical protein
MPTCADCVYRNDYADPGRCYADMEYHAPDDSCSWWQGTLRKEPVNPAPLTPDAHLAARVGELDSGEGED